MESNMTTERVFRNSLTPAEYKLIGDRFSIVEKNLKRRDNHYYDTSTYALHAQDVDFRAINEDGHWKLALKAPRYEGMEEIKESITEEERVHLHANNTIRSLPISTILKRYARDCSLQTVGRLRTHRAVIDSAFGQIMLDKNEYLGKVDYEIKLKLREGFALEQGEQCFKELLLTYQIERHDLKSKFQRFWELKKNQMNGT